MPTQPTQPAPVPPSSPQPTIVSVAVGVAGNLPATVAPGEKLQLFAQATSSDGTVSDVTNVALWQSSNPMIATVSSGGLLTAFGEGALDVSATYQSRTGSLRTDVAPAGCRATLSPASLSFGALSKGATVMVTTTRTDCRWTVKSGASWLPYSFDPGRSGSGGFAYTVPGNNNPDPRDADIVVSVAGGPAAIHHIHQDRPVGCVYQVSPVKLDFGRAGGNGSFTVTTIPGDCQWKITDAYSNVTFRSATSGTGSARVDYVVSPNASVFDRPFLVQGLSGLNPPATHVVSVH